MISVDFSVRVDFFNEVQLPSSRQLIGLLEDGKTTVAMVDLVVSEVLRGFRQDQARQQVQAFLLRREADFCAVKTVHGSKVWLH